MNAQSPSLSGTDLAAAAPAYPSFVTTWLRIDLGLCVVTGLLALAALASMVEDGTDDWSGPIAAFLELAVSFGIAGCGIAGNLLLLRKQRSGFLFAGTTLLLVCVSAVLTFQTMQWRLTDPDTTCPTDSIVTGYVIGVFFRGLTNLIYFDALRRAHRFLQRLPSMPA